MHSGWCFSLVPFSFKSCPFFRRAGGHFAFHTQGVQHRTVHPADFGLQNLEPTKLKRKKDKIFWQIFDAYLQLDGFINNLFVIFVMIHLQNKICMIAFIGDRIC